MTSGKGGSYFYAIIGISLVLLVLGIAGVIGIEARKISTDFRENFIVEVVLKDAVNANEITGMQSLIKGKPYVKAIKFITKEEALKMLKSNKNTEIDLDLLSYNPLYNSFVVNLFESYINEESVESIRKELLLVEGVQQVNFQQDILSGLNKSTARISLIMLVIAGLLMAFAVSLIFNTIRLAMFSKRFNIKTMQLFGATRWFIIKPFLGKSIFNGLLSGLVACMLLTGVIWYFDYAVPELGLHSDLITFALLFGALIVFGIFISFFSTLIAVFHYLRIKVEDLY